MMYRKVTFSPDGSKVLVQITDKPFSHLVPYSRFARRIEVWSLAAPWATAAAEVQVRVGPVLM